VGKFRKKPVEIDAFLWTGGPDQIEDPEWVVEAIKSGVIFISLGNSRVEIFIRTLYGVMLGKRGDWIIRGVKDEIYLCKPDIFEATYEKVEE
jgi:hypothetical protein